MKRPRPRAVRLQLELCDRGRPRTPRAFVARVVRATLAFARRPALPVSVLPTDDREIAALHAAHLGDASPTDVMSFALDGAAELVVSVQTARRRARELGHAPRAELALYLVHGLLHQLGFDDLRARDRARMRVAEQQVLRRLRLAVAPVDASAPASLRPRPRP